MERDVRVLEVHPEPEPAGHLLPFAGVAEDALDAFADEFLDAVGLDFLFRVDAKALADLDLDGQAVGVPAGFTLDELAAHGLVAREEVLDGARQAVPGVRQAVGGRGALVEDEARSLPALVQ